ncbi:hypothetical protein COV06_04530 [Candidatus Uhrbacteria bacterium CG10_big_fil_rev_8_21_14_0_10_50_16]|uniref:HIT domain-containing protein n=1 Tax=Candidatus Uhrbacteria bacterium CG10_big_fil_rev_8_21_14_0_10_50_16 TaxID=1975039 RepID=A0A2H0RLA4_9BACT|nr:MAG: hypothetical protein COV06_04530 [Candidatus Uhrbacteria bacterium CG10_big_fil_rev_8_21_14_0_10_50_16]
MSCALCDTRMQKGSQIVCETDLVFVMVNFEPVKDPHVMVLPKRCLSDMRLLSLEESFALFQMCDRIMDGMERELDESPMMMVNGVGFRTQPQHLHIHILPSKYPLRGLLVASENRPERRRATNEELVNMADRVKRFI